MAVDYRTEGTPEEVDALALRVWAKIDVGDCWLWTAGARVGVYGGIKFKGKMRAAHRMVWCLLVGPIPDGLELDHLCVQKLCVNPDHIEPVTPAVNVQRAGAHPSRWMKKRTECRWGHPYTPENTYRQNGRRSCIKCRRLAVKRWADKKRAA